MGEKAVVHLAAEDVEVVGWPRAGPAVAMGMDRHRGRGRRSGLPLARRPLAGRSPAPYLAHLVFAQPQPLSQSFRSSATPLPWPMPPPAGSHLPVALHLNPSRYFDDWHSDHL